MAQTMAEYLMEQGQKRGQKRGETKAKREAVLKLLHLRFDTVPESITSRMTLMRSLSRLDSLSHIFSIIATASPNVLSRNSN